MKQGVSRAGQQSTREDIGGEGEALAFVDWNGPQTPASPHSAMPLPEVPMAPISEKSLPKGEDWGYQLKWDGVRILARIGQDGKVELYSRNLLLKNAIYPEIAEHLQARAAELGPCLLDGEVVWWNGIRPNFQQVLKRERSRGAATQAQGTASATSEPPSIKGGLVYVLFDLLMDRGMDLRSLSYIERHRKLTAKFPVQDPRLFVTELFHDGEALWRWVEGNQWEGVVSKRLSSPYREGKKHQDWYKKKTALLLDVDIVGLKWRNHVIASLIMAYEGAYLGSVSLGLTDALRGVLASSFESSAVTACPFPAMPADLKKEKVQWLPLSFRCRVTGLELTSAGQLRHPKLVTFLPKEDLP